MRFPVWIAEGFGSGKFPKGPGTVGSVVGVLWFALLLFVGNFWVFLGGVLGSIGISVWACGAAEKILNKHDPGSIVIDEIVAVPCCFLAPLIGVYVQTCELASHDMFFSGKGWILTAAGFGLFRLFDIWKPWPVGKSQVLPGGWGVTADDLLAAVYVSLVLIWFVA